MLRFPSIFGWLLVSVLSLIHLDARAATEAAPAAAAAASAVVQKELTFRDYQEAKARAKKRISECAALGKTNPKAMLECSGYLVAPSDYARCTSDDADALCAVTPVCGGSSAEGGDPRLCTPYSAEALAKWSSKSYPNLKAAAAKAAVESVKRPMPDARSREFMQQCAKKHAAGSEALRECMAGSMLSKTQKEVRACVDKHHNDLLAQARSCVPLAGPKFPKLSEPELKALECGLQKTTLDEARSCLSAEAKAALKQPQIARLEVMLDCTPGRPSFEVLGACLLGASNKKALELRARAQCFKDLDRDNPSVDGVTECLRGAGLTPKQLRDVRKPIEAAVTCARSAKSGGVEGAAQCMPKEVQEELKRASVQVECLKNAEPGKAFGCANKELQDCYDRRQGNPGDLIAGCLAFGKEFDPALSSFTKCAAKVAHGAQEQLQAALNECEGAFGKNVELVGKAKEVQKRYLTCDAQRRKAAANDIEARARFAACMADVGGLPPVMDCALRRGGQTTTALVGQCADALAQAKVPGVKQAVQIYNCYSSHGSGSTAIVCAGAGLGLKGRDAKLLACLDKTDKAEVAWCVAGPSLPREVRQLGTCALQAASWSGAAACAAKTAMPKVLAGLNAEWQAAVECAATSGGNPVTTATCTGTRLAIMELTKCVATGKVGGNGCFGKNNTIVRFYVNYYKAITRPSWGRNNDVRRGLRELDELQRKILCPWCD